MQHPLGQRAVTEERHRHATGAAHLVRQRTAHGERNAGTDDAVGPEHADVHVGHVHGTATAAAQAGIAAHDLGEQAHEVDPARQAVAVTAVIGGDGVGRLQRRHHAGGNRLLTDAQMDEPRHFAGGEQLRQAPFRTADAAHGAVQGDERVTVRRRTVRFLAFR